MNGKKKAYKQAMKIFRDIPILQCLCIDPSSDSVTRLKRCLVSNPFDKLALKSSYSLEVQY